MNINNYSKLINDVISVFKLSTKDLNIEINKFDYNYDIKKNYSISIIKILNNLNLDNDWLVNFVDYLDSNNSFIHSQYNISNIYSSLINLNKKELFLVKEFLLILLLNKDLKNDHEIIQNAINASDFIFWKRNIEEELFNYFDNSYVLTLEDLYYFTTREGKENYPYMVDYLIGKTWNQFELDEFYENWIADFAYMWASDKLNCFCIPIIIKGILSNIKKNNCISKYFLYTICSRKNEFKKFLIYNQLDYEQKQFVANFLNSLSKFLYERTHKESAYVLIKNSLTFYWGKFFSGYDIE